MSKKIEYKLRYESGSEPHYWENIVTQSIGSKRRFRMPDGSLIEITLWRERND